MINRRKFLKNTCLSCVGTAIGLTLMQSCSSTSAMINAKIEGADLILPLEHFENTSKGNKTFKSHLIVSNDKLSNPICVFRISENTYKAFLLKCTHQGAELQVFGDKMECPAHGSEFNTDGFPIEGPATDPLRSFPVTVTHNQLLISLK